MMQVTQEMTFSHVTSITRNSELIMQEREKGLAICFSTLWRNIVQGYLLPA